MWTEITWEYMNTYELIHVKGKTFWFTGDKPLEFLSAKDTILIQF